MDLAPEIQDGFGPNPNPTLLTYPNKGFGFEPPQIHIQIQIYNIQTYCQKRQEWTQGLNEGQDKVTILDDATWA